MPADILPDEPDQIARAFPWSYPRRRPQAFIQSALRVSLKTLLLRSPNAVAAVRAAKRITAPIPSRTYFWDGTRRSADLGLTRLFRLWRHTPELRAESEAVYQVYDGNDFVDVGAYHGWYAALLSPRAKPGASFVMVEPDPGALPPLLRTLSTLAALFPHVRYIAIPRAAGDGSCVHITYPYGPGGHPRFASSEGPASERSLTLDQLTEGLGVRPSLVKIDVEGAEYFVVRGGLRVFSEAAPTVMLETHPDWQPEGVRPADVAVPLRGVGYEATLLSTSDVAVRELWRMRH